MSMANIYFDTDEYDLIRKSLEKPIYKEKLRLRAYGIQSENSDTFIEIKKKFNGVVYKRRIKSKYSMAKDYLYNGISDKKFETQQIFMEIEYMMKLYKLHPKVYIAYDRRAYFGKEDPEFRVTFDKNIVSRSNYLDLRNRGFDGEYYKQICEEKYRKLEELANGL